MKQLRIRAILLTCWLIVFYVFAHFWETISISPIMYLFLLSSVIFVLVTPHLRRVHLWWMLSVPAMVFLVLKAQMDFPLTRSSLFVTLIETCAIVVTTLMLVWVRNAVHEFESAVNQISDIPQKKVSDSALEKQSVLYREVRRARNHQRPLVLLAIGVEEKSIQASMERLLQEAQQNFIRQYTLARVSKTLCEKLEDCDLVVQTDNNFLILLPETKLEDLSDLTDRLRNQVSKDIGVEIQVGAASLPHDGFTFEGLVDKANLELQANMESKLFIEPEQLFVKHKVT